MAKKSGVIRSLYGTLLNVREYVSLDEIKRDTNMIASTFKEVLNTKVNIDTTPATETFEEALIRMNITEEVLKQKTRLALYYSLFYLFFALSFVVYAIYIFYLSHYLPAIAILSLAAFLGSYSLRESFTYMQMKKRNFNITGKEWFYSITHIKKEGKKNEQ